MLNFDDETLFFRNKLINVIFWPLKHGIAKSKKLNFRLPADLAKLSETTEKSFFKPAAMWFVLIKK